MPVGLLTTTWTGGPSSPGKTIMCIDGDGAADFGAALAAVRQWWIDLAFYIPTDYVLQVDGSIDLVDEATGQLSGEYVAATPPGPVTGGYSGVYASGSGYRVDWATAGIRNGRRVRGRTYIVPLGGTLFTGDGVVDPAVVSATQTAATTLIGALDAAAAPLGVYSRPIKADPAAGVEPAAGVLNDVIGSKVPSKGAFLRGRRD